MYSNILLLFKLTTPGRWRYMDVITEEKERCTITIIMIMVLQ